MGYWGTCPPPRLPTISFLVHFGVIWQPTIQVLCSLQDQLVQMSTPHSLFDQYCISHKTISHRSAAAAGPEIRRECPMTKFPAMPLLATNPGDATVYEQQFPYPFPFPNHTMSTPIPMLFPWVKGKPKFLFLFLMGDLNCNEMRWSAVDWPFSPTNGRDHVKTSRKFGSQYGWGTQVNWRMFITLFSYFNIAATSNSRSQCYCEHHHGGGLREVGGKVRQLGGRHGSSTGPPSQDVKWKRAAGSRVENVVG